MKLWGSLLGPYRPEPVMAVKARGEEKGRLFARAGRGSRRKAGTIHPRRADLQERHGMVKDSVLSLQADCGNTQVKV